MPDEIRISVIFSYAAEVYQKTTQRLEVLYYHCTLHWLQLAAYLYFHPDGTKQFDLFSVLSSVSENMHILESEAWDTAEELSACLTKAFS